MQFTSRSVVVYRLVFHTYKSILGKSEQTKGKQAAQYGKVKPPGVKGTPRLRLPP